MWSYAQIRSRLIRGEISTVEVVRHYLQKIKDNGHLNAFVSLFEQEGLKEAARIDRKIKGGRAVKLAGMILGIKDLIAVKDQPLSCASPVMMQNC